MKILTNRSVKWKITLWLTILMALLSGLLLMFMLTISRSVTTRTSMDQLSRTMRDNAARVSYTDGRLQFEDGFQFSLGGVSTLVYSRGGALMAGQLPVSFSTDESFENGNLRVISSGGARYLMLDLWIPSGWEDGVWLRGLLEMPEDRYGTNNILRVAAVALPLFILLAAAGGYMIVRRSFRPLDQISATASAISEAKDLSRRIGLPPGKDEFSRLAETFDSLFERLERSFEAESQFTADASHELRTPVSIIRGACEYGMKYDETAEERKETLEMIHRQTVKMSELITQLLSMTRLEQGTELPEMAELDLTALAESVVEEMAADYGEERLRYVSEESADAAGHTGSAQTPAGLHTVRGDAALLRRLLRNLIDNGFKYGRPDGHVWVSVSEENGEVLLRVRDDGIGISAEHQEKIWQRFYQVDPSRGEASGAGLGLAMVSQIAGLHGGRVTLESVPDVGSVFALHLPGQTEPLKK